MNIREVQTAKPFTLRRLGGGWYDFKDLPQDGNYIKIHALRSITDRKAINTARKILGDPSAKIEIKD